MVIGYDDIDARPAKPRNGRNCSSAAITGHDDFGSRGNRRVNAGIAQVVTILDATRDKRTRLAAQTANDARKNGRRADPIDVVVAMDEYELPLAYRAHQTVHSLVHRQEAERIVKPIELWPEKQFCFFGRDVAADQQQPTDDIRQR